MIDSISREIIISTDDHRQRIDKILMRYMPHLSRTKIQSLVTSGNITLHGKPIRNSDYGSAGDCLHVKEQLLQLASKLDPENIQLEILYEDEDLLVVNKVAGMVVHRGAGHETGTLVNALLYYGASLSTGFDVHRPGIVHRLDKDTSGCIVIAKSDQIHGLLSKQFADRQVKKTYLSIVQGRPRYTQGSINLPIGRHPVHRQKMTLRQAPLGREAITDYHVLAIRDQWSLLACFPHTGRTHQIRIHLQHLGHPIAGDPLYGKRGNFTRHLLHAWKLGFIHPRTQEPILFIAPVPQEFNLVPFQYNVDKYRFHDNRTT